MKALLPAALIKHQKIHPFNQHPLHPGTRRVRHTHHPFLFAASDNLKSLRHDHTIINTTNIHTNADRCVTHPTSTASEQSLTKNKNLISSKAYKTPKTSPLQPTHITSRNRRVRHTHHPFLFAASDILKSRLPVNASVSRAV